MIFVAVDFQVLLYDEDGTEMPIGNSGDNVYEPIPDSAYRHNRWMGLFRRRLTRVAGFGREFLIDENWRAHEAVLAAARGEREKASAFTVVVPPNAKKRGCGCRGDSG